MGAIASQITSLTIVYSTVYSDADQRKHRSSAPDEFTAQMASNAENVPFDDVMINNMDGIDTPIQVTMVADITNHYLIIRINWQNEQVITENHIVKKTIHTEVNSSLHEH